MEDISDDCIAEFVDDKIFESSSEPFLEIENTEVKNTGWENKCNVKLIKIIAFVYFQVLDFKPNRFEIKTFVTKKIFTSVKNLLFGSYVIHHSHVTGEIIGYVHWFCNLKITENQNAIPAMHTVCLVLTFSLW